MLVTTTCNFLKNVIELLYGGGLMIVIQKRWRSLFWLWEYFNTVTRLLGKIVVVLECRRGV